MRLGQCSVARETVTKMAECNTNSSLITKGEEFFKIDQAQWLTNSQVIQFCAPKILLATFVQKRCFWGQTRPAVGLGAREVALNSTLPSCLALGLGIPVEHTQGTNTGCPGDGCCTFSTPILYLTQLHGFQQGSSLTTSTGPLVLCGVQKYKTGRVST